MCYLEKWKKNWTYKGKKKCVSDKKRKKNRAGLGEKEKEGERLIDRERKKKLHAKLQPHLVSEEHWLIQTYRCRERYLQLAQPVEQVTLQDLSLCQMWWLHKGFKAVCAAVATVAICTEDQDNLHKYKVMFCKSYVVCLGHPCLTTSPFCKLLKLFMVVDSPPHCVRLLIKPGACTGAVYASRRVDIWESNASHNQ